MNAIQILAVSVFFLLYLFFLVRALVRSKITVVGTGGTVLVPLLAVTLVLILDIEFSFTDVHAVESLGLSLLIIGIILGFWAEQHIRDNSDDFWTARRRHKRRYLVTTGPYRWVRHPVYTSTFLFFGGLLVILWHPVTIVLVFLYFVGIVVTAFREEKFLSKTFSGYSAYRKNTGMFFPKLKPSA